MSAGKDRDAAGAAAEAEDDTMTSTAIGRIRS